MFGKRGNDDGVRHGAGVPSAVAPALPRRRRCCGAARRRAASGAASACRPPRWRASRSRRRRSPPSRREASSASAAKTYYDTKIAGLLGADRHDRPVAARQARCRERARGNPRHRQRHHRDQELRDVDRRAGGTARGHLQRRSRLRSARAAAGARRHRRHHGQRLQAGLHRSQRQGRADRHPLPRQPAAAQHLPAHRQPGRPPRRRILARSATPACPTARASTSSRRRSPSTAPR